MSGSGRTPGVGCRPRSSFPAHNTYSVKTTASPASASAQFELCKKRKTRKGGSELRKKSEWQRQYQPKIMLIYCTVCWTVHCHAFMYSIEQNIITNVWKWCFHTIFIMASLAVNHRDTVCIVFHHINISSHWGFVKKAYNYFIVLCKCRQVFTV